MPTPTSEADIIQNRINVTLAKSQRLVASWLPPQESTDVKSMEDIEKEQESMFTPIPPRLGLGAPIPRKFADGDLKGQKEFVTNNKLRRKLLSRGSPIVPRTGYSQAKRKVAVEPASPDLRDDGAKAAVADMDSDDGGRSAQWTAKRQRTASAEDSLRGDLGPTVMATAASRSRQAPSRQRVNFLDELLQEKGEKRKKGKGESKGKGSL